METFSRLIKHHKTIWTARNNRSLFFGVALFLLALSLQKVADTYVGKLDGTPVQDIILNHLPTLDIDAAIMAVTLIFTAIVLGCYIAKPKYINFGLKAAAIFIIIRAFFITLTHLGASPHELQFDPKSVWYGLYNLLYNTHGDFFFSGHTGLPFLTALIFWEEKVWRYLFLATTVIFGVAVLIAHIHYSIDVFAAPFIVYSIFAVARTFFKHDYQVSRE